MRRMIRASLATLALLLAGCATRNATVAVPKGWVALPDPGLWCLPLRHADLLPGPRIDSDTPAREFLDWLAQSYGRDLELYPGDIRLYVSNESPPTRPGHDGTVAGEILCLPESAWRLEGKYQITLYRDALVGETASCLYSTIAHEFRHIVQEIESDGGTHCGRFIDPPALARLERDALEWARAVAPECNCPATP